MFGAKLKIHQRLKTSENSKTGEDSRISKTVKVHEKSKISENLKAAEKLKPIATRRDLSQVVTPILKKLPPVVNISKQLINQFAKLTNEESQRLFIGDFTNDFSRQTSRFFRIFLSSTFSDFKVERNELYRRVFPPIKQRCAQIGFEFQVVDMRWGVSDTADIDHTADIICMNEIDQCIEQSAGLNFIYLVGNRYGYMYVPLEIDEDEFEVIIDVAKQENISNRELIEKWFLLDNNSRPAKYLYVPVTTYYKDLENERKKEWANEEKSMVTALRVAVDKAMTLKKLSQECGIKYFQSITEREIRRATVEKNRSNVIGIIRNFSNPSIETAIDAKFFDGGKNERIKHSIENLKNYCNEVTGKNQLKTFLVPWKTGGLNIGKYDDHREYIDELCEFLIETILRLIDKQAQNLTSKVFSPFHEDLLHHGLFCREKTKFFFGREELLENIHGRIETQRKNVSTPLAIVAESGSGKTAFMAKLAQELRRWYPNGAVVVRFLGTSGASSSLELVLRSICGQLEQLYGSSNNNELDQDSLRLSSLIRTFHELLRSISKRRILKKNIPKPLFILLDAIDQLSEAQKSSFYFESWLMRYLPRDVHIIVSFMPTIDRINLRESFLHLVRSDETALFNVPRLRGQDCEDIVRSALEQNNRQLNPAQYSYLLSTAENNAKPLYLKLLIDIARTWNSFNDSSLNKPLILPETIEETIEQLFAQLENRHGNEFAQYSLAYLVYGLDGITESELEDCLSINDVVLNEIYAHHDPPIPNSIHVPSLLCQSFLFSINDYLTRKRTFDKHILSFYHRKFFEATRKRYAHLRQICHEHLIEIYTHESSAYQRTISLKKRQDQIITDADRLIGSQLTSVLNKRKLVALPYHCLQLGSTKDDLLKSACLFNFQFLSCQLEGLGYTTFFAAIRQCLRLRPNWSDLKRLYHAVWSMQEDLVNQEVNLSLVLAEQILGFIDQQSSYSLYQTENKNSEELEKLLKDCRFHCRKNDHSLESIYAGFPQENSALAWTYSTISNVLHVDEFQSLLVIDGCSVPNNQRLIAAETIAVVNNQTGKMEKIDIEEKIQKIWAGYVTKNGEKVYVFGEKAVLTFASRSGDFINERILSWDSKSFCNKAFCMSNDEETLLVANEWRILALDEIDQNSIYRSGRIPTKNPSFSVDKSENVKVCLRLFGSNEKFCVCLLFDELNRVLMTIWSLTAHEEILPLNCALILHEFSSPSMFDVCGSLNENLYLLTTDGVLRTIDLLKLKPNSKVAVISTDETIETNSVFTGQTMNRLVCSSGNILVASTQSSIHFVDRRNPKKILQTIELPHPMFSWQIFSQDEQNQILLTVDLTQKLLCIYRQEQTNHFSTKPIQIEFRSSVKSINLLQSTTMLENDEKKKIYALMLLEDNSAQLLDTDQITQSTLQPEGLFSKFRQFFIGSKCLIGTEFGEDSALLCEFSAYKPDSVKIHRTFQSINIQFAATFDDDQFYLILTKSQQVKIYSWNEFNKSLFDYDLNGKISDCFSVQTYQSNVWIFLSLTKFLFVNFSFDSSQNSFIIQSEQIISIPQRLCNYNLELTKNRKFLILSQNVPTEENKDQSDLKDIRVFNLDKQMKISPCDEPIFYLKSKTARSMKTTSFHCYATLEGGSVLWIGHQGNILQCRLTTKTAELQTRPDYHSWTRHALALYQKTAEKSSLSVAVTSLAVEPANESCVASGADDGSIILWFLTNPYNHLVLDSVHEYQISALQFETSTNRMFSASIDRTIGIWSPSQICHVLRVHIPIDDMKILPSENFLVVQGKFWAFDRLLLFYIGGYAQNLASLKRRNNQFLGKINTPEASDVASWAL